MIASGFAALGYQMVWTQQSALWLGHEAAAIIAVVAAFFAGLATGSGLLGSRIERSPQPGRWYAACEAVIGAWGLLLVFLLTPASALILTPIGTQPSPVWQWAVAFAGTFILLLPATAAMGATLPAMERCLAQMRTEGTDIAALYAGNTGGAVLGVLVSAFWLVPTFGLANTALLCVLINFACAGLALKLPAQPLESGPTRTAPASGSLLVLLAITGTLGIGYEVLVVRVLGLVAENTVFTFALLLACYLVGTAGGAAAYDRWIGRQTDTRVDATGTDAPARVRNCLLRWLAIAVLLCMLLLAGAASVKSWVMHAAGPGLFTALAAEASLAAAAFLLPAALMGALFSHLCTEARQQGTHFGRALAINTAGAAIAPLLFGVLALPLLGARLAIVLVAAGYLALSAWRDWKAVMLWAGVAATVTLAIGGPALRYVDIPKGGRLISYHDGALAAVSVVEDASGVSRLHINNRQQEGSSATLLADARQAILPLLLHPAPKRALFLGLGTGVTAASAAEDPALQVEAVELLPEVIEASVYFRGRFESNGPNPRLRLLAADARRYVRASDQFYDLIVSDNFHPARSGSGPLYTVEHFAAVRERLTSDGVFVQWLPLHQLDLATLRSIVRSFLRVYPASWAMLATNSLETPVVGLVARRDGGRFPATNIRTRLATIGTPHLPADFGIVDDLALFGSFIAGPPALERFAGNAPANTDDHPVVTYLAPRITYFADSLPRDRLLALLTELDLGPAELVDARDEGDWPKRLTAYFSARNQFLRVGRDVKPTADVRGMLAQVREPLLSVLHTSPDFQPAYDPLLRMAIAAGNGDSREAISLLSELQRIQPARPEAARALREFAVSPH
jgi:spermidine synthase